MANKKMKRRRTPFRPALTGLLLVASAMLAGCWWDANPAKINSWIDEGKPEKALTEVTKQLEANPQSPVLNLLGAKARLVLCAHNSCTLRGNGTTLLQPVAGMLARAGAGKVKLDEQKPEPTLTAQQVVASALPGFTSMDNQPKPLLMLLETLPSETRPLVLNAVYTPALQKARAGRAAEAAEYLNSLTQYSQLGKTPAAFGQVLAGLFSNQPQVAESFIIQLRSAEKGESVPGGTMALLPWALLAQAKYQSNTTTGFKVLEALPAAMETWQLSPLVTEDARAGLAEELNTIRTTPALLAQWSAGWPEQTLSPDVTLQRLSLGFNPNQPQLWATYLPAFINAVSGSAVALDGLAMSTISATTMSVPAQQKLAGLLLQTAQQLVAKPAAATPLLTFAGSFSLSAEQQSTANRLTQQLLTRAGEQADVTSTLALALFRPEVAQNNRQVVLPLLVASIRSNLHTAEFEKAVSTADTLTSKLKMDIELAPIILEEFAVEMRDRKLADTLFADDPAPLLKPEEEVRVDLGPLFGFMNEYFADKPEVITAQLTTLVAGARGTYGPSAAMYRLGWLFPEGSEQTPEKRQEWINRALTEELLGNTLLSGPQLASVGAQLAQKQPGLMLAPLLGAAVAKAATMEDSREIWRNASAATRQLLETTHPQYSAFMRALDAQDAGHLNTAAAAFGELTTAQWKEKSAPFVLVFQKRLADVVGTYVPVSADPSAKTAAVVVRPLGLEGQALNQVEVTFINRLGTHSEENPVTYTNTPTQTVRTAVTAPLDFDTGILALTPEALAALPQSGGFATLYGNVSQLAFGASGQSNVLQFTVDDQAVAYTRVTAAVAQPLRPDGTYLVQSVLNTPQEGTGTILPIGALLHLATVSETQAPLPEWNLTTPVYALTGDLEHPASAKPIPFTGFFDPLTLTLQFGFSYPLPQSGLPVKAAVRCQALAGPIICGSHHLHSPRRQFATLVGGMQTKESLAQQAEARATTNAESRTNLLDSLNAAALAAASAARLEQVSASTATAAPAPLSQALSATAAVTPSTSGLLSGTALPAVSLTTVSASTVSATVAASSTVSSPAEDDEASPTATTPPPAPAPAMVQVPADAPISKTGIAPGVFIHRTSAVSASTSSPTTASPTTASPSQP